MFQGLTVFLFVNLWTEALSVA